MLLPAVSVLTVGAILHAPPRPNWARFPSRCLAVAIFLIPGVLHALMVP
jgi:hypothetical protein